MTRIVLLLLCLLGVGCDAQPAEPTQRTVRRVVSASPAATEICCALGLRKQLVGRSKYCTYPPGIEEVASIGGLVDANPEMLLKVKPDLILISGRSQAQRDRFQKLGLRLESLPDGTLDDIYAAIEQVGMLCQRESEAAALRQTIQQGLAEVDAEFGPGDGRRVLLVLESLQTPPQAPTAIGPGSFLYDLMLRAGYQPAVKLHAAYAGVNLEVIARADPQVIVEVSSQTGSVSLAQRAEAWSRLGDLQAVRSDSIVHLANPRNTIPGPRVVAYYAEFRAALASLPPLDAQP